MKAMCAFIAYHLVKSFPRDKVKKTSYFIMKLSGIFLWKYPKRYIIENNKMVRADIIQMIEEDLI